MILLGEATITGLVEAETESPGLLLEANRIVAWIESLPLAIGDEIVVIRRERCAVCGAEIEQPRVGRPRRFCSAACKAKALREAKREAKAREGRRLLAEGQAAQVGRA